MSQLCPHGFAPSECLICRTLGVHPQGQVETSPEKSGRGRGGQLTSAGSSGPQEAVHPDTVYGPDTRRGGRSLTSYVVLMAVGVLAVAVAAWFVVGIFIGLLHAIAWVVVVAAAGWAGYRIGHHRGRRVRP